MPLKNLAKAGKASHIRLERLLSQKLNRFQEIARSSAFLGWFHLNKGEYTKARDFFENAIEVFEKAGAKSLIMFFSQWVIWTYIELGEIEKAKNLIDDLHVCSRSEG